MSTEGDTGPRQEGESNDDAGVVGLDMEYLLLGCSMRHFGCKVQVPHFPSDTKELSEELEQFDIAVNAKAQPPLGLEPKWLSACANLHDFITKQQRLRKVQDLSRHPELEAALGAADGRAGSGIDCKEARAAAAAVVQTTGPPSAAIPTTTTTSSTSSSGTTKKNLRADAQPDHIFEVTPHSEVAINRTLSARVSREFSTASSDPATSKTTMAFHGSPNHNWYPIIQNGFRNVCKDDRVIYGNGVYFSTALHVSQDFSSYQTSPFKALTSRAASSSMSGAGGLVIEGKPAVGLRSSTTRVVGVCEIAHTSMTRSHDNDPSLPATYLVVKNPSHVVLRYLLVFEGKSEDAGKANAASQAAKDTTATTQKQKREADANGVGVAENDTAQPKKGAEVEAAVGLAPRTAAPGGGPPPAPPDSRRRTLILTVLIVVLAIGVRLYGKDFTFSARQHKLKQRRSMMR